MPLSVWSVSVSNRCHHLQHQVRRAAKQIIKQPENQVAEEIVCSCYDKDALTSVCFTYPPYYRGIGLKMILHFDTKDAAKCCPPGAAQRRVCSPAEVRRP